ncbi:uncharacterized protein [Aegilops tauschii subsp. strangulata]|uniref:uncharacterized protein n=1 Tax=Aegilops tauschii subsp. strangulata TaxID=200361 RepID=UPI001E1C9F21|nr:uncharacterized protein LOC120963895 [Aegilops tauschii subsp. strangulata]
MVNTENPKEHHSKQNEPPPQADTTASKAMDTEANPADNRDPPSPIPSSTPVQITEEAPLKENTDDVAIIGASQTTPKTSTVLDRHSAKEESPPPEKGKTKLELPNYEALSAEEVYAGYLSRLNTSRDMEASLVQIMKQKYEEALNMGESDLAVLRKSLKSEEVGRAKAELSLKSSLEDLENMNAKFNADRSALETEKATLLKRTEDAENQLKTVVVELAGLKYHVFQMTVTIFGARIASLGQSVVTKLKAIYCLTEKLYAGTL